MISAFIYDVNIARELVRDESRRGKFNISLNLKPGTYYVLIQSWWDVHYGNYKIVNKFNPNPLKADKEPNDNLDLANNIDQSQVIEINSEVTGHLGYYGSGSQDRKDWYKITVPSDGYLEFTVTNDSTLGTSIFLYDVDGKREIMRNETSRGKYNMIFPNIKAGTYYLLIQSIWDIHYGGYKIENKFIPNPLNNDVEPNEKLDLEKNIDQSQEIPVNSKVSGHLGYYGNGSQDRNDRFKITLPSDGYLEITITNDDSLTTYAFLYDVNGKREILRNETRNRSYKLIYPNLKAGTYYLLISSLWDIHYGGYTIENKFIPQNIKGDKEPNDNINNAVDVSIPSVISGTLGYYGNEKQDRDDFFKFHIPQEMDLDIYLTEEPTLITYIFIYNGNKQEIARNDIGVSDYQISLKLKPGTYYIQVNSIGNHLYGGYYIGLNRQVPSLFIETPKKAEEETANIIKITNPINNHTYAVIDKNLSWEEAKDFCENREDISPLLHP